MKKQTLNSGVASVLLMLFCLTTNVKSYGQTYQKIEWKRVHPTQSRIKYAISKGRKIVFNRVYGVKSLPDKLKGFQ